MDDIPRWTIGKVTTSDQIGLSATRNPDRGQSTRRSKAMWSFEATAKEVAQALRYLATEIENHEEDAAR